MSTAPLLLKTTVKSSVSVSPSASGESISTRFASSSEIPPAKLIALPVSPAKSAASETLTASSIVKVIRLFVEFRRGTSPSSTRLANSLMSDDWILRLPINW